MPMMHLPICFSGTGTGTGTGALYDRQNGIDITLKSMGKINLYQTTTKHNKAQTICKFLGLCIIASHHTVRYHYNAVNFLTNSHILHPITHLWELEKGFLLWVELWYILQYHIWGHVIPPLHSMWFEPSICFAKHLWIPYNIGIIFRTCMWSWHKDNNGLINMWPCSHTELDWIDN